MYTAEQDVVELLCSGYSNSEIAKHRGSSPVTVNNQLCSIYKKLSIGSRHELIALATAASSPCP